MLPEKRRLAVEASERRVRPRKYEEPEVEVDSDEAPSEEGMNVGWDSESKSDVSNDGSIGEGEDGNEEDEETPEVDISSVSFRELKKAHDALVSTRNGSSETAGPTKPSSSRHKAAKPDETNIQKRSSKHAPTELTAKKAVPRHRDFVRNADDKAPEARDPRFDPLCGPVKEASHRRAYAFLDSYRAGEVDALRAELAQLKKQQKKKQQQGAAHLDDRVEELKRTLMSMENRRKAEARRDEERMVLEEHRRREKELVREGKTPFYLKRGELKKRVLAERFKGMSEGQVNKSIVRKRKKVAGREKKELARLESRRDR
jgi:ribosomal RNA-processing protein 36